MKLHSQSNRVFQKSKKHSQVRPVYPKQGKGGPGWEGTHMDQAGIQQRRSFCAFCSQIDQQITQHTQLNTLLAKVPQPPTGPLSFFGHPFPLQMSWQHPSQVLFFCLFSSPPCDVLLTSCLPAPALCSILKQTLFHFIRPIFHNLSLNLIQSFFFQNLLGSQQVARPVTRGYLQIISEQKKMIKGKQCLVSLRKYKCPLSFLFILHSFVQKEALETRFQVL